MQKLDLLLVNAKQQRYMKHTLLFSFILFTFFCRAQNLVPNPSFEDTLECPDFPGQVWRAEGWFVAEQTPDYFHSCCNLTHPVCGVPNNILSSRFPTTGVAYCGFGAYASNMFSREKIGIKLSEKLSIGTTYYVSLMLSSVSSHIQGINGGSDKVGVLFSTLKYDLSNLPPTANFCHVWSAGIITDTLGWVKISGSFVADSNYEYLTIGNFFTDSQTNSVKYWTINGNFRQTYYFVDDVCVTTDSNDCFTPVSIPALSKELPLNVFPNPTLGTATISSFGLLGGEFNLYNIYGQSVFRKQIEPSEQKVTVDISSLSDGTYIA